MADTVKFHISCYHLVAGGCGPGDRRAAEGATGEVALAGRSMRSSLLAHLRTAVVYVHCHRRFAVL